VFNFFLSESIVMKSTVTCGIAIICVLQMASIMHMQVQVQAQTVDPFERSYADPGLSNYPVQNNWDQFNNIAVMFTLLARHARNISFTPSVPESWDQPTVWMSIDSAMNQCKQSTVAINVAAGNSYTIFNDITFVSTATISLDTVDLPTATRGRVVQITNESGVSILINYQGSTVSTIVAGGYGSFVAIDISGWKRIV
jgi:hypothetical protein